MLTGTASLFRPERCEPSPTSGARLPGITGDVYDTVALTEDNELTIALKSLGALMVSPLECTVVTELMPTWRALWTSGCAGSAARSRTSAPTGYAADGCATGLQQFGIGYGVIALFSYLALMLVMALALDSWIWFPFWLGLGAVFTIERGHGVEGRVEGPMLAALLIPELCFDMYLNVVYVKGIIDSAVGRRAAWTHLQHQSKIDVKVDGS